MERLGGETVDLNTTAEEKVNEAGLTLSENKIAERNDVKSDGESDVDSAVQVSNQEDTAKAFVAVVPAPSLFCSSSDKDGHHDHSPARSPLRLDSGKGELLKSAFTPTTSTVCSLEFNSSGNHNLPEKSSADNQNSPALRTLLPAAPSHLTVSEYV